MRTVLETATSLGWTTRVGPLALEGARTLLGGGAACAFEAAPEGAAWEPMVAGTPKAGFAAYFAGDAPRALAEGYLATVSLILMAYAVAWPKEAKEDVFPAVNAMAALALMLAAGLSLTGPVGPGVPLGRMATVGRGMLHVDAFTQTWKALIALAGAGVLLATGHALTAQGMARYEFTWLVLWVTLAAMLMVSSADLLAFYVALEFGALAGYILVASRTHEAAAIQGGLTYFILGALASGMMLLGIAVLYQTTGTTDLAALALHGAWLAARAGNAFEWGPESHAGGVAVTLALGWTFLGVGVAWKLGAAPFHQWVPAVYTAAPRPVVALLATVPKLGMLGFLGRLVPEVFATLGVEAAGAIGVWGADGMAFVAALSLAVGTFGALQERRLMAILAYSAVAHIGYMGLALAVNTTAGTAALMVYALAYVAATVGALALVASLRTVWINRSGHAYLAFRTTVDDLKGLYGRNPGAAVALMTFILSMAGIPPLAGFLAKMNVFMALIQAEAYGLASFGAAMSVVAAYYYLRVVGAAMFLEADPARDPATGRLRPSAAFRAAHPAFEAEDSPAYSDRYAPPVRRVEGGLTAGTQGVVAVTLAVTVALMAVPDAVVGWADAVAEVTLPDFTAQVTPPSTPWVGESESAFTMAKVAALEALERAMAHPGPDGTLEAPQAPATRGWWAYLTGQPK